MRYSLILFLCFSICAKAQNYSVNLIPDSLKENANAVKRFEELRVIIKSPSRAIIKHKYAITILNEAGERYNGYYNSYDKLHSLYDISGHLYDANGKELKSVKKKDLSDLAYNDEISLISDNRVKQHSFYYKLYPFTIEYEDEQEYDGVFFLPPWVPAEGEKFAVQNSSYIIEFPENYTLRYKQFNYPGTPQLSPGKYSWQLTNQKAIFNEVLQPPFSEITTSVYISPSDFEIARYRGNMNSWQNLGQFISTLNQGKDVLPEAIVADIQRITAGLSSKEEKIKAIYNYLQQNTRYISIQLGIGGWQPFEATYVASKRYGDCKALSNYMVSMLKAAGIKSNYVLITAGEGRKGLWEDFPSPYFNHAIMCVPDGKDTLWLECTSQTQSPGFMGSFTGNRKALMITDEGGVVVKTPTYTVNDNQQLRKVNAVIDAEGNLTAEINTRFTGEQQELQHALIHSFNAEQREKYLNSEINLPTYKVEKSDYKEHKFRIPAIDEYLKITAPSYAAITGKRLFVQPNLFSKSGTKLSIDKPRKYPIEFTSAFRDVDTITISIPQGYQPEAIPKNVTFNNKFGKYMISFTVTGDKIDVLRLMERYSGTYPPSDFIELAKFYEDIYKADRGKIVLVKKE